MPRVRLRRRTVVTALLLPFTPFRDGAAGVRPSRGRDRRILRSQDFLGGLGVNGHVSWPGHYPYSGTEKVADAMAYVGVRTLRDHINVSTLSIFERLAARGVRFDLLLHPKVGVDDFVGLARALARSHPGSIAALEGPNEVDKWPVAFRGLEGFRAAAELQKALRARARAEPELAGVPIYNLTVSGISRRNSDALGDLSAHADYANVHPYYRAGQQSWGHSLRDPRYTLSAYMTAARWTASGRPVVLTETGSTTAPGSAIGVTEAVQARQILNSLFAAAAHGASAVYIYELVDSHNDGPDDVESHYGLYRYDWTPKPAAHALHNLTRILDGRRPGRAAQRPLPAHPPAPTVEGMPPTASSLILLEDDGSYALILWAEPDPWAEDVDRPIAPPRSIVRVDLGAVAEAVDLYDPLVGRQPQRTFRRTRSLEVALTDHPIILKVS